MRVIQNKQKGVKENEVKDEKRKYVQWDEKRNGYSR